MKKLLYSECIFLMCLRVPSLCLRVCFDCTWSTYTVTRACPSPQPLGGDSPKQSWARGGDTYDWRATAPTLFDFVLTVTSFMHLRDLTPIVSPTQHPCIQPPSATHSHPPHCISANLIKLCSRDIPLRILRTLVREFTLPE